MTRPIFRMAVLTCLGVVAACQRGPAHVTQAGDLRLGLDIRPNPPVAGENHLLVELRDAAGKPVEGAQLSLSYDMPAMGAMPEMRGAGEARVLGGGRYEVGFPLSMLGDWTLTLDIHAEGHAPALLRLKVSPPHKGLTVEGQQAAPHAAAGPGTAPGAGRELELPPERQQLIGVTYATVEERPLAVSVRAAGRVQVDERQVVEVTLKYEAYIEDLRVGETGKAVRAGEPLLRLYSPDLLAAEEELLQARRAQAGGAPGAETMVSAAARRLRLWDLTPAQLAALGQRGQAEGRLTIYAPTGGVVLEKSAVAGMHVMPGTVLYRIGNLGRIWVQAALHEIDAPLLAVGQPATLSLPALPGASFAGRVSFVAPTLDDRTHTLEARLEFPNAQLAFKPGMFGDVHIEAPLGVRLAVPDSALLLSGEHRYAFVARGPGRLQAVEVHVGAQAGDYDEVRSGLSRGDRVVTGAAFLVSSEARLRDALPRWGAL